MLYEHVSGCYTFQSRLDGQLQAGLKDCMLQRQIEIKENS